MKLNCNCCDGIYNSFDVHFTSACDNKCAHCIDQRFDGLGLTKPDTGAIVATVVNNAQGLDDVLFLGGEPCLYLDDLLSCVRQIKAKTALKVFVTTSVPKICHDQQETFHTLIDELDGINLSVQHHREAVADQIRRTSSAYDRQAFYRGLPHKEKIRVNLNVVKPYLHTKEDLAACLRHYDKMGFNSIKLSEIQHGKDVYVSFADVFGFDIPSAYSHGCQSYLDTSRILPGFTTPLLLKRSCFLCEESLTASLADGLKMVAKVFMPRRNKYGVVYENGSLQGGWV
jgi:organic radical activating enzyme